MLRRKRLPNGHRVFQLLVDGMHPRITRRELAGGYLPNLQYLIDNGRAQWDVVSIFPTSTPSAVTSIMTGAGPDLHEIPGMYWYDRRTPAPVYYGENLGIIGSHFGTFFDNLVGNLNLRHLSPHVSTVFEQLEMQGKKTASLNSMCFRGPHAHPTTLPVFLRMIPGVRFTLNEVSGPLHMRWGDFARSGPGGARVFGEHGPFRNFGISDECTMDAFFELAAQGPLPDYLALYFPNNDIWSHQHGPESSGIPLRHFDFDLGRIFDMLGGREKAIADNSFFVIADHAQVTVGPGEECGIDLDQVLSDYKRLPMGAAWHDHDLFLGPNGRFAMLYLHPNRPRLRQQVFHTLAAEPRIEHILWREGSFYHVHNVQSESELCFERGLRYRDRFGNGWRWQGDPAALGLEKSKFIVDFQAYPDTFVRISEALDSPAAGDYTLTARPGFEFAGNGEDVHLGGGSHGGLCSEESLVPFIACGPAVGKRTSLLRTTGLVQQTMEAFGLSRKRFALKPAA